ncbi:MAG: lipoic acid synthetase [Litorivivens sp.]|jgi:lipoic acid synthetase
MNSRDLIPATQIPAEPIESGKKFVNDKGITAIKNGIKASSKDSQERLKKPSWLRIKAKGGAVYDRTKNIVYEHKLSTVCEEAMCPFGEQRGTGG